VVYSKLINDEAILTSMDAGAISYVAKSESGRHLFEAIRAARSHKAYVGPRMATALLNHKLRGRPALSQREREVVIGWCRAESKEAVAEKLCIETSTVRTHLQRVRAKYAAVGRPAPTKGALIARVIQDGLLRLEDL
jgi:DNA-binding NarL/FixJ family response regulator